MRVENRVSLWLGTAPNSQALADYVRLRYADDGDIVPSQLMADFGIDSYDENFREAEFLAPEDDRISEILKGFSYDAQVIDAYESAVGNLLDSKINAVVLLYNYDANVEIGQVAGSNGVSLKYYGAVEYEPTYA